MRRSIFLATVVVNLAACAVALALGTGKVLFSDTFSTPSSAWRTGSRPYGTETLAAGKLRLAVNADGHGYDSPRPGWRAVTSETVTADVTLVSGSRHSSMGLMCVVGPSLRYDAVIGGDGVFALDRVQGGSTTGLWRAAVSNVIHRTKVNHMRAECSSSGSISLTVNGTRLFSTVDKRPLGTFTGAGIVAATGAKNPAVTVDFDNFKAVQN
jgi:hypothetical protein